MSNEIEVIISLLDRGGLLLFALVLWYQERNERTLRTEQLLKKGGYDPQLQEREKEKSEKSD